MEIVPGIHWIPLRANHSVGHVNCYLIQAGDGYVLVDCAWNLPAMLSALEGELRGVGADLDDVHTLVVTHLHADHYGLAGALKSRGHLRLLMHPLDWQYVRENLIDATAASRARVDWQERNGLQREGWSEDEKREAELWLSFTVVAPDLEIDDGDRIETGTGSLQVIWTPGHTLGHVCLYDAERRVLFASDHVLKPLTPRVSLPQFGVVNPLGNYLASLRKVAALEVDQVLPGHGEPFTGLARRVEELLTHHERREAVTLEALSQGSTTGAGIAGRLPWRRGSRFDELSAFQQRMALSIILAHLEDLQATGRACSTARNGRIYWEAAEKP